MKEQKIRLSISIFAIILTILFSLFTFNRVASQSTGFPVLIGDWLAENSIIVNKGNPDLLFSGHNSYDNVNQLRRTKYFISTNRGLNWTLTSWDNSNSWCDNSVTDFQSTFFGADLIAEFVGTGIEFADYTNAYNLNPITLASAKIDKPYLFSDGYFLYCSFYYDGEVYVYRKQLVEMIPCMDNGLIMKGDGMAYNWTEIFRHSTSVEDDDETIIPPGVQEMAIRGVGGNNCRIHLVWNDNQGNLYYANNENGSFEIKQPGTWANKLESNNTASIAINKNTGTVFIGYTDEDYNAVCSFKYYDSFYQEWVWGPPKIINNTNTTNLGKQWYTWVSSSVSGNNSIVAFTYYDIHVDTDPDFLCIAYSNDDGEMFSSLPMTYITPENVGPSLNPTNIGLGHDYIGMDINADNANSKFELYSAYTTKFSTTPQAWVTKYVVYYSSNEDDNPQYKVTGKISNYPNPFNPTTTIKYSLPKDGFVTLKVYDISGREIQTLVYETKKAGDYAVDFNGSSLASGVYFYRIQSGDFVSVRRMLLVK